MRGCRESDKDDDNDDDDDDGERSDSEEDLVLNDLDESAESGDSEIEENKDQPALFDQVILRSGRLATTRQSQFLVRN